MWLLVFGIGTVLVRAGLLLVGGGSAGERNWAGVLTRAGADVAAASLAFWAVGAALLLGPHGGFVSVDRDLLFAGPTDSADAAAGVFYHWAAALVGGAVVSGAVAGRGRFAVGTFASAVLAGVVYPVVGHLVWFGWLRSRNVIDFGGALAIHLPAAVFAAVAAVAVSSRGDRGDGTAGLPLVGVGVGLVAVGWVPYLLGALVAHPTDFDPVDPLGLARTAMNVALAGAAGLAGGLAYGRWRAGRGDAHARASAAVAGLLGGLVAISAACDAVGNRGAILTGLVAGVAVPAASAGLGRRVGDPSGLVAVHGVGAVWGVVAAALFALVPSVQLHIQLLFEQLLALAVAGFVATVAAAVTFGLLRLWEAVRPAAGGPRP